MQTKKQNKTKQNFKFLRLIPKGPQTSSFSWEIFEMQIRQIY